MSLGVATSWTEVPDECQPQRILIVDEHELAQAGLCAVLRDAPWVDSCAVAGTAEGALHVIRRRHPQLILVSLSLGGRSAIELCHAVSQQMPHIKIVLLSNEGRIPAALASSVGAVAALSKQMQMRGFVDALKRVADGARVFPKVAHVASSINLSRREREVLQHLASGLSNPELAELLHLSRHTVKQHTSTVYRKLGVRNRAEAAVRAQELGLVAWRIDPAISPASQGARSNVSSRVLSARDRFAERDSARSDER